MSLRAHALIMVMVEVHGLGFGTLYINHLPLDLFLIKDIDLVEIDAHVCQIFVCELFLLLLQCLPSLRNGHSLSVPIVFL